MSIKSLLLKYFRPGAASNATSWCNVTTLESPAENTNALGFSKGSLCRTTPTLETADANFAMRYLVKLRIKTGQAEALARAIADATLGCRSIALIRRELQQRQSFSR